jgi:hypothetical protein
LQYYIDGKYIGDAPFSVEGTSEMHVTYPAKAFVELSALSEGSHSLRAVLICSGLMRSLPSNDGTVYFTIDTNGVDVNPEPMIDSTPPNIPYVSLENAICNCSDVSLNFTISEYPSLVTYTLDGAGNITIAGNTTLTGLSVGAHNLTIYAWDATGNAGASRTVKFDVASMAAEAEPQESFLTVLVVAAPLAVVAVFGVGIFLRFRKRKQASVK